MMFLSKYQIIDHASCIGKGVAARTELAVGHGRTCSSERQPASVAGQFSLIKVDVEYE